MIRKIMNACKLGLPKVNLVLEKADTMAGEKISGAIYVQGGWIKQETARLECDLVQQKPGEKAKFIAPARTILMTHTVGMNEKKELPFRYRLPTGLIASSEDDTYQLRTKLVFKDDSACTDYDVIIVHN